MEDFNTKTIKIMKEINSDQSFIIKAMNDELVIKCNEIDQLKEMLDRINEAAHNITVSTSTDSNKHWCDKLDVALDQYQKWKESK